MTRSWWRRNTGWLILLVPMLLLALAATSFRLVAIWTPMEWTRPTVARASVGTLEQTFRAADDRRHARRVTVEVDGVRSVRSYEKHAAIVGATMWQVDLTLTAAPDQLLQGCTIELVDAEGTRYGTAGGRRAADPDDRFYSSVVPTPTCVPKEAPGPEINSFTGEPMESAAPRPETWQYTTTVVIPDGHEPRQLRIGWTKPVYLVLDVP